MPDNTTLIDDGECNRGSQGLSTSTHLLVTFIFILGAIGNLAALWILYKFSKARNTKHILMLKCLITNDLVAVLGMLTTIYLKKYQIFSPYITCLLYVGLRAFGLVSGCVAFAMALERWLALTRPFLYQQLVTYQSLKRFIFALWTIGVVLSYLPLVGFGLWYKNGKCCRYREAKEFKDVVYAYVFMAFGTTLCFCIAWCNLTVIWEVARIGNHKRILVRRVSRSTISNRVDCCTNYVTAEELAFAKLMAMLCVIFLVCWLPQMICIPIAQYYPEAKFYRIISRVANMLMCLYFALDPFVYVLYRYMEKGRGRYLVPCFLRRSHSSTNIPTPPTMVGTPTSILLQPPSYAVPPNM